MNMNTPPPLPAPPAPVAPALAPAIGGVWRLTWHRFTAPGPLLTLLALLAAMLLLTFIVVGEGRVGTFFEWVIQFHLMTLVPITAFVAGGSMVRDDMKPGVVDYVLTRPVRRPVFVLARFTAHLAWLQLVCLVLLAGFFGVAALRNITGIGGHWPILLLAQVITLTAFLALGYLCGAATSRYLVLGIVYGLTIETGLGNIPIQLSKLSVLRHVRGLLAEEFPGVFEQTAAVQGAGTTVAAGLLFAVVWLAAAAGLYALQEFAGQRPKEA